MKQYNPSKIEPKWQKIWERQGLFRAADKTKRPKFYCLVEFPYPSGAGLHVGHLRSYSALDAIVRKKRMQGFNVLYPMGWDAFGLPTENYAIKTGMAPQLATRKNIAVFKKQIKRMGLSFDWSREINTTDPKYYKWTQWIFLQLFKRGLAYQKEMPVNWCPSCKIGLANEEVIAGKCERCGVRAQKKILKQWMLKITAYAERLLCDLDTVDYSPRICQQQVNWIGRSEGAVIKFQIAKSKCQIKSKIQIPKGRYLKVFTTRPDTLFGATYMVVCPEHEIISNLKSRILNLKEIEDYISKSQAKSDLERTDLAKEKTGVQLKGLVAINPVNNKQIPIFVADYVLPHYGTGAIMAVPAHDQRDLEFAKKFDLSVVEVVRPDKTQDSKAKTDSQSVILRREPPKNPAAYEGEGIMINSEQFNGLNSKKAVEEIVKWLTKKKLAKKSVNYKLRDWLFSRQHYWGEPIPIVHCEKCAQKGKDVLILHGWMDSARSGFIPALRKNLQEKGYNALAYDAPNTQEPDFNEWLKFTEAKIKENKLQNFNLVGHSMGGLLALKLAEKYKLKKLILVAPVGSRPDDKYFRQFKGKLDTGDLEIFKNYQDRKIDVKKIKANTEEIIFIFGSEDHWINQEIRDFYIKNFQDAAVIKIMKGARHMSEEDGVKRLEAAEDLFSTRIDIAAVAVPEKALPVKLPVLKKYQPTGTGESPLAQVKNWVNTKCPQCGGPAKRETDTMPNWAGSSWYFLRYCDPQNDKKLADAKKLKYWLPVDLYNGGMEHTTLHLLYSRFWHKFLFDIGVVPTTEPYQKRRSHGVVLAEDSQKMSKSRGNVINPDEMIKLYGADTLRVYEMFMGPFSQMIPWSTQGMIGVRRFLEKIWALGAKLQNSELKLKTQNSKLKTTAKSLKLRDAKSENNPQVLLHQTIKKLTEDLDKMHFNTAVSSLMILTNKLTESVECRNVPRHVPTKVVSQTLLILLAPFAPHIAEELWQKLGHKKSIFLEKWPQYDPALIQEKTFDLIIQINGKVRDRIKATVGISQKQAEKLTMTSEKIRKWLQGNKLKKVIFIEDRLINFVI